MVIAETVAVVDNLSAGRVTLGVGMGYRPEEFAAFHVPIEERGERMRAGIEAQDHGTIALRFKECIEGWNLVLQGLRNLIQMANMDSSTVEIGGQSLSDAAASMRGITLKMADAFTRGDMASLNVVVTEELGEYINPLREVFERVLEKLEEATV